MPTRYWILLITLGAIFGASFGSPNIAGVASALDGTGSVSGTQVFNYFELHDDAWPLNGHDRAVRAIDTSSPNDDIYARGRTTLANTLTLLSKGVPGILQGTEWLENDGWEESKIDWGHKSAYSGVFDMYRDVIALRTSETALHANENAWVYHSNNAADVLAMERWINGGESFVVVANFSNNDHTGYRIGLPRSGTWGVELNTQDSVYNGSGVGTNGAFESEAIANGPHGQSVELDIPAMGVLVLRHAPAPACVADLTGDGELDFADISAFLAAFTKPIPLADLNNDGEYDFIDITTFLSSYTSGCP